MGYEPDISDADQGQYDDGYNQHSFAFFLYLVGEAVIENFSGKAAEQESKPEETGIVILEEFTESGEALFFLNSKENVSYEQNPGDNSDDYFCILSLLC
jgi:hypothetical protein